MEETITVQGRILTTKEICLITSLIENNPAWKRTRISEELCKAWDWKNDCGRYKDMACRTMLLKLERKGYIKLPPSQNPAVNHHLNLVCYEVPHEQEPVSGKLKDVAPIRIKPVMHKDEIALFKTFMQKYHYLGLNTVVGENIKYMVYGRNDQPLACLLFGASAWKTACRDVFIGWNKEQQKRNLPLTADNNRFLILPWVRVKFLASHILSQIAKQISGDWVKKYGHPVYLLETFVQKDKFKGTCYQAAGWIYAGDTKGRGKKDRYRECALPEKSVWLYPLKKDYRNYLVL